MGNWPLAITNSPMPSLRLQRVRELLKREIGEVIRREIPVGEAGLISVNDVEVSGDLHSATVFTSILGNEDQQKRGFAMLARHRKRIQSLLARAVILKYTPRLRFVMDDSIVRGNRVLEIIEELEQSGALPDSD
jgi:ribosome-binding factor A